MIARKLTLATLTATVLCMLIGSAVPVANAMRFGSGGGGSGRLNSPSGIAVDQASNDLYVADRNNRRIDKFDQSGSFLLAWGWGVNEESPANELQTCTETCQPGISGKGAGEFSSEGPRGVAVDNDPLSSSYGDVYVVDWEGFRVEKYDPSGKFILMFGEDVNETTGGDVCVAGETCKSGTKGTADGQFEWAYEGGYIAVGPGGAVYVGDEARVQVFEPSGAWKESISLAGLSSTGKVTALATDTTGDIFVSVEGVTGVREFEPNGTEKSTQFDTGSTTVEAIALDPANEPNGLFVVDSTGGSHILQYDAAGKELSSFGFDAVDGTRGIAVSGASDELYVASDYDNEIVTLTIPVSGPTIESESAVAGERGVATLEGYVDPQGGDTSAHFEYVDEASYRGSGFASASSTPTVTLGSGFDIQPLSAALTGLVPGAVYHYRLVATNSAGTVTGSDQVLTEVPAALVEGPWAADVTSTSATLAARIDPLGASTEYRLEYGTSTSYEHVLTGSVGEGRGYTTIGYHEQELQPATVYHYRLITTNQVGTVEGTDQTFTTQAAGRQELVLPDGRAWELVSPPNKNGALIEAYGQDPIQAASDGSGITYGAFEPLGENTVGKAGLLSQILSKRGPSGWRTQDINLPHPLAAQEEIASEGYEYRAFSPNLSVASLEQTGSALVALSPETAEGNRLYLRNDMGGSFTALLTPADVPPSAKLNGEPGEVSAARAKVKFLTATPDQSHVIIKSQLALTPDATRGENEGATNLYEWGAGILQLVNILPDGHSDPSWDVRLAGEGPSEIGAMPRAVSDDGRWVAWTTGRLYVRDMVAGETMLVGGIHARFQTMSSDGSRIFFLEGGELYEFDTGTHAQTSLSADHETGESDAGVQETLLGVSDDGSYAYFVATGILASGATGGEDNLYVAHESGNAWTTRYIATLSGEDKGDWYTQVFGAVNLAGVASHVSSSGRYLTFMSSRSLTGYDNIDANSDQPDEEVYLYDGSTDRLICASCDTTGARPVGIFSTGGNILMDRNIDQDAMWVGHWLGGIIPGWDEGTGFHSLYQPRSLSNSGRLFFDSPDALVPRDTNGLMDTYEYEPVGVGSCTAGGVGFTESLGGCVSLISSGTSSSESAFFDASEDGDDVFFLTSGRLTAADYDTSVDVYDAHVCSSTVPCTSEAVSPPPCTSGDSCKAAPSPQPEIFGPAPSATFSGTGNVVEEAKKAVVKHKIEQKSKHKKKSKTKRKTKAKRKGHRTKRASKARTGTASRKGHR